METVVMKFATYCKACDVLMKPGTLAKKFDGATFEHVECIKVNYRRFAAHKQPDTGMWMGGVDEEPSE